MTVSFRDYYLFTPISRNENQDFDVKSESNFMPVAIKLIIITKAISAENHKPLDLAYSQEIDQFCNF